MGYLQSFSSRFTRTARPFVILFGFATILSFFFVLFKAMDNPAGPGKIQRLAWQSWDIIAPLNSNGEVIVDVPASTVPSLPPPSSGGEKEGTPSGVDWWDVPEPEPTAVSNSLPLDQWAPLLPHDTGITEIAITRCLFDPRRVPICWPSSTKEEDAIKGPWVRVERDLNVRSGIFWLHLYYRRTRRLDVPLITDLKLLGKDELDHLPKPVESWRLVDHSIRDGVIGATPLFLHYKLGPPMKDLNADTQKDIITEIDVLHGFGPTWYGFDKLETPVTEGKKDMIDPVWLVYRKGVKPLPPKPRLHFSHSGEFKIMQIADLHYSVMRADCLETTKANCTDADGETATLIAGALDAEKPDLVVFTGDQLNGGLSSWDSKSILAKFAEPVVRRKIPWAAVLGNHDAESDLPRDGEIALLQMLPYSLVEAGPKDVNGEGNYVLKVHSADASKTQLFTLYFLDSGAYSKGVFDWFGFHPTEYDWIKPSQIDWFLSESAKIKPIERPFKPDGGKDLGNIWAREEAKILGKPNAMMFFHIPLPESYYEADVDPDTKNVLDVGQQLDANAAAKTNGGLFEKGLLIAKEVEGGKAREVKVVANGHCHISDNCRRVLGVWLCFGGGGAYGGYSKPGFDRRFRIYKISEYGEKIETYKRTERGDVIDNMILAGPGAPAMGQMSGVPR